MVPVFYRSMVMVSGAGDDMVSLMLTLLVNKYETPQNAISAV